MHCLYIVPLKLKFNPYFYFFLNPSLRVWRDDVFVQLELLTLPWISFVSPRICVLLYVPDFLFWLVTCLLTNIQCPTYKCTFWIRGGHSNTLQYFCLENPMDRGAWRAIVHGVTKSWTRLSDWAYKRTQLWSNFYIPGDGSGRGRRMKGQEWTVLTTVIF